MTICCKFHKLSFRFSFYKEHLILQGLLSWQHVTHHVFQRIHCLNFLKVHTKEKNFLEQVLSSYWWNASINTIQWVLTMILRIYFYWPLGLWITKSYDINFVPYQGFHPIGHLRIWPKSPKKGNPKKIEPERWIRLRNGGRIWCVLLPPRPIPSWDWSAFSSLPSPLPPRAFLYSSLYLPFPSPLLILALCSHMSYDSHLLKQQPSW